MVASVLTLKVHADFFHVFPNPFFQSDSSSYLTPVLSLLFNGTFPLSPIRTPGYPLFLAGILSVFSTYSSVLVIQHILHLLTASVIGFIYFRFFNSSLKIAVIIGFISAVLARPLVYAHTFMSDNFFAFLFIIALAFFLIATQRNSLLLWILTGFSVALAFMVRPAAWALFASLALGTWVLVEKKYRMRSFGTFIGTVTLLLFSFSGINWVRTGYFGLCRLGPITLFGSTAYLLSPETIANETVREVLRKIYKKDLGRFGDQNWVMYNPEGPAEALRKLKMSQDLDQVLSELSRQTLLEHPIRYSFDQFKMLVRFLFEGPKRPQRMIPKENTYLLGMQRMDQFTQEFPQSLLFQARDTNSRNPQFISDNGLFPFDKKGWLAHFLWPVVTCMTWMPISSVVLTLFCIFLPETRGRSLFFLSLICTHIILSNVGAGIDGRYGIPLEPIYILLFVAGVEKITLFPLGLAKLYDMFKLFAR